MVVIFVVAVLLFNAVIADDMPNGVPQGKDKTQNLTLRASAATGIIPAIDSFNFQQHELMKPQLNSVVQNRNDELAKCPSYKGLLAITDKLLNIINEDPSKADTVSQYKEILKSYSKPVIHEEDDVHLLKNTEDEDAVKILSDNNILRMSNDNIDTQGGVKTKIIFKYELPNIIMPDCKAAFLDLMQTAYETYQQLAKYPTCQKLPNIYSENDPSSPFRKPPSPNNYLPLVWDPNSPHVKILAPLQKPSDLSPSNTISILGVHTKDQNAPSNQIQDNTPKDKTKDLLIKIVQNIPDTQIRAIYINIINSMRPDEMAKIPHNFIMNILVKYYPLGYGGSPGVVMPGNRDLNPANDELIKALINLIVKIKSSDNDPWNNKNNKYPQYLDNTGSLNNFVDTPSINDIILSPGFVGKDLSPPVPGSDVNNLIVNGFHETPNPQEIDFNTIIKEILPTYGNKPVSQEVIELLLKIPYLKEHILKFYGILPNPNIDLSNLELLRLLIFNKINNSGGKIPTLAEILGSRNPYSLEPNNAGVVELTYIVRKPTPVYFVKYQLPYSEFVTGVQNILLVKPHLKSQPKKLYEEIINLSKVSDVSPDLKAYPREDLIKLTYKNGELIGTKLVSADDNLKQTLREMQNLNNNVGADEILNLNKNNEVKYYKEYELYDDVAVGRSVPATVQVPSSYPPFGYFNQQKLNNDLMGSMIMRNYGLHAMNPIMSSGMARKQTINVNKI